MQDVSSGGPFGADRWSCAGPGPAVRCGLWRPTAWASGQIARTMYEAVDADGQRPYTVADLTHLEVSRPTASPRAARGRATGVTGSAVATS